MTSKRLNLSSYVKIFAQLVKEMKNFIEIRKNGNWYRLTLKKNRRFRWKPHFITLFTMFQVFDESLFRHLVFLLFISLSVSFVKSHLSKDRNEYIFIILRRRWKFMVRLKGSERKKDKRTGTDSLMDASEEKNAHYMMILMN